MEILTELTHEENEEIRILIEKRDALKNLLMLLKQKKENNKLLQNAEIEYEMICKAYEAWWSEIIVKYAIQKYKEEKLSVDCEKRVIIYKKDRKIEE